MVPIPIVLKSMLPKAHMEKATANATNTASKINLTVPNLIFFTSAMVYTKLSPGIFTTSGAISTLIPKAKITQPINRATIFIKIFEKSNRSKIFMSRSINIPKIKINGSCKNLLALKFFFKIKIWIIKKIKFNKKVAIPKLILSKYKLTI